MILQVNRPEKVFFRHYFGKIKNSKFSDVQNFFRVSVSTLPFMNH